MTTVAYRNGFVAADSRVIRGEMIAPEEAQKIWRVSHGGVAAIVGTMIIMDDAKLWLDAGKKGWERPKFPSDNTYVVEFLTDGTILEHSADGDCETKPMFGYYAWGSGRDFAYGALAQGATAFGAVEIAAKFDLNTGGTIRQLKVSNEDEDDGC